MADEADRAVAEVAQLIKQKRGGLSEWEFLRRLVNQAIFPPSVTPSERAQERVLARGMLARRQLELAEGSSYSEEEVKRRLASEAELPSDGRGLVAWQSAQQGRRYPKWQFTERGLLPGIQECLAALETGSDWERMIFFLSPRASLGGQRPLDLLREGRVAEAVGAAQRHGGHGPQ